MMKLYVSNLENVLESKLLSDEEREVVNIFLAAINDWPYPIRSLEDYETSLRNFLGDIPKKDVINNSQQNSDLSKYAWQMESLAQISSIFNYYKDNTSLDEIIQILKKKLENS